MKPEDIRYVLENELNRKYCSNCGAVWVLFNHNGLEGIYRLSPVAPEECPPCHELDKKGSENAIMTAEGWIKND